MPKSQKSKAVVASQSTTYYVCRVAQQLSLLLAAASTIILWASLAAVAHTSSLFAEYVERTNTSSFEDLNLGISNEISKLTQYAVFLSVLAIVVSLLLLYLPRVRKYDKRMVVNGVVIAGFCFVAAAWCQPIYRAILSHVV